MFGNVGLRSSFSGPQEIADGFGNDRIKPIINFRQVLYTEGLFPDSWYSSRSAVSIEGSCALPRLCRETFSR